MHDLGYAVVNVGERDIRQGYDAFESSTRSSGLTFVSANLVDQETQQPVFPTHVIVEAVSPDGKNRLRVGIVGVMRFNPIFNKPGKDGRPMAIVNPTEPVRTAVAALEKQSPDLVVLLGALHKDDARRIVREVPGIDFVVGAYGGLFTTQREQEGSTWLLYSGNQGKRIGSTRVFLDDAGSVRDQTTTMHFMTYVYPADETMMAYLNEARPRASTLSEQTGVSAPVGQFAGATVCKSCHAKEYASWSGTGHATAMSSLVREGKRDDPACLQCHTTGAGQAGGFGTVPAVAGLDQVGCESCHGPGGAHVRVARKGYGAVAASACVTCHDVKNSPEFDYYSYLPRVSHAAAGSAAAGSASPTSR